MTIGVEVGENRISRGRIKEIVPKNYHNYAGIGPYLLPIWGIMYWSRLKKAMNLIFDVNAQEVALTIGDMGSGFGIFATLLGDSFPKSKVVGLDKETIDTLVISTSVSNMCNVQNTSFIQADACMCPLSEKKFDVLFALDVLEHLPDPLNALFECRRNLKEDGILIISVPVESKILVFVRHLVGIVKPISIHPHWQGNVKSFQAFCEYLSPMFKIEKKFYFPINLLGRYFNYDCFFICKNK